RDDDGDGIGNACDVCPEMGSADQRDTDHDGVGDSCDNCPTVPNSDQRDLDGDGIGDACDACVATPNPDQRKRDGDRFGGACARCPTERGPDEGCPCMPTSCDDRDPCTDDACAPSAGCQHTERVSFDAVTCRLSVMRTAIADAPASELKR